jgi:hypothetical protein
MSKDSDDCEVMNELFGKSEDELPYVNHWRPVAIVDTDGEEIRKLTKEEQIAWIRQQRIIKGGI